MSTLIALALIEHLIKVSRNAGDRVLDAFSGSGTTSVACRAPKRQCPLVERELEYMGIIWKRLAMAVPS